MSGQTIRHPIQHTRSMQIFAPPTKYERLE